MNNIVVLERTRVELINNLYLLVIISEDGIETAYDCLDQNLIKEIIEYNNKIDERTN